MIRLSNWEDAAIYKTILQKDPFHLNAKQTKRDELHEGTRINMNYESASQLP